jgi:hypothetical protein
MNDPRFIDRGPDELSVESKISDLLVSAAACAILDRRLPGFTGNPQLKMMHGLTFRDLADYDPDTFSEETINDLSGDLTRMDA